MQRLHHRLSNHVLLAVTMESHHRFEVLETFMKSFVHGKDWPKQVFAIVLYDGQFEFVAKNSTLHAEDQVLDHFKQLLMNYRLSLSKIQLFLSASPCGTCSENIIDFVNQTRLSFEIVFTGLYNIRRPSCVRNPDCHRHLPSDYEHNFHVDGLKKLYWTQGISLRPFTEQDWVNLKVAMGVPYYDCTSRENEDFVLRRDFEEIMEIRPSAFFPKPAFPMEPSRLVTARDSSLYESHSRHFMDSFHDHVNYQSWDSCRPETSTCPSFQPRDLGHPVPSGHYMNMEYDGDARRPFRSDF